MLSSRLRILFSITISFILSFGITYVINNYSKIASIRLPDFSKIFTLNYNPSSNGTMKQNDNNKNNNFSLPTGPQNNYPIASPTSPRQSPTIVGATAGPTNYYRLPTGTRPTARPQPTSRPLPTAVPEPTSTPAPPPITSNKRPGATMEEIFQEVNKRICVPVALMRAFQEEETGPWFSYYENPVPYNTYGWWTNFSPNPCYKGFGYDASTGYFPADTYDAGKFCMLTPGANPGTMGLFAIDQWEQDATRKNTLAILPNNIDRRVIFDAVVIFASATINRVYEPECGEVWPDDVVINAAAKHVSGQYPCQNATCEQYSNDILSLYKKYR